MDRIIIIAIDGTWHAAYDGPHKADALFLFGSTILPTPFDDATPKADVVAEIARLNPDVEVA